MNKFTHCNVSPLISQHSMYIHFVLSEMTPAISCNNLYLFSDLSAVLRQRQNITTSNLDQQSTTRPNCENWLRFMRLWIGLANMEIPSLRFHVPPSVRPLRWHRPLKSSRCSLYHSYDPHLRLSSPSVSNSSSFIETNRLEVTPGRAHDDSGLLRPAQTEGFSFASKTLWYSFVAVAPNFLLASSTIHCESLRGLLNRDIQPQPGLRSAEWCCFPLWLPLTANITCFILKGIYVVTAGWGYVLQRIFKWASMRSLRGFEERVTNWWEQRWSFVQQL